MRSSRACTRSSLPERDALTIQRESWRALSGSVIDVEEVGTGVPVLALPGLGGGSFFFRGPALGLADRAHVVTLDLPGTGRSTSTPAAFTLDTWMDDLEALVCARFDEPVVLLGHSMGTILALEAWRRWPDRIRALACLGGLPRVRPAIRERLTLRRDAIRATGLAGWGARAMPGIFAQSSLSAHAGLVALYERVFEAQSVESYTRSIDLLLDADARDVPASVTVPTVLITGDEDQYAPPDDVRACAATFTPAARVVVLPSCGHAAFFEAPHALSATLADFLGTV